MHFLFHFDDHWYVFLTIRTLKSGAKRLTSKRRRISAAKANFAYFWLRMRPCTGERNCIHQLAYVCPAIRLFVDEKKLFFWLLLQNTVNRVKRGSLLKKGESWILYSFSFSSLMHYQVMPTSTTAVKRFYVFHPATTQVRYCHSKPMVLYLYTHFRQYLSRQSRGKISWRLPDRSTKVPRRIRGYHLQLQTELGAGNHE